jgi:DNA polymerase III sliding clamp (beta) subunit (PCNA family)
MPTITTTTGALRIALSRVKHAAAKEEDRPILHTVLFEGDGEGFRLVTADNYRIAIARISTDGDVAGFGRVAVGLDEVPVIQALIKRQGAVTISHDEASLTVSVLVGRWRRSVTLPTFEGTWPNYASVVGMAGTVPVGIRSDYLYEALRAAGQDVARVRVGGPTDPVQVDTNADGECDYTEIIMPVRLVSAFDLEPEAVPA